MARASSRSPSADRLVVFVHQNDRPPPGALVQRPYQATETDRRLDGTRFEAGQPLRLLQLVFHVSPNEVRRVEIAPAEADPHDRIARRPVPPVVYGEAPEQFLASLEQLLQRVHQKGLAEPARTRQEIVLAPLDEAARMVRLVDVVAVHPPDLPEGGKAGRKHASRHPDRMGRRAGVVKRKRLRVRRYVRSIHPVWNASGSGGGRTERLQGMGSSRRWHSARRAILSAVRSADRFVRPPAGPRRSCGPPKQTLMIGVRSPVASNCGYGSLGPAPPSSTDLILPRPDVAP